MKNIIENNKLITEFMGLFDKILSTGNIHSWSDAPFYYTTEDTKEKVIKNICKYSKYDSDWNWLMTVVFKCLEICHNEMLNEWENGFSDSFFSRDINCMYSEVVRFIEWYNNKSLVNPDESKINSSTKRDKVLKSIMERYGGLCNLKSAMREDEDVVLVNLCDDLNDEFSEREVLLEIIAILK